MGQHSIRPCLTGLLGAGIQVPPKISRSLCQARLGEKLLPPLPHSCSLMSLWECITWVFLFGAFSSNIRRHCVLPCELAGKHIPWLRSRKSVNAIRFSSPYGTNCSRGALCQMSQHSMYFSGFPPYRHKLFLRCRRNRLSVAVSPALGFPGTALEPLHLPFSWPCRGTAHHHRCVHIARPRRWDLSSSCWCCWTKATGSWWCPQSLQQKGWANEAGTPFSLSSGWMFLHQSRPSFPLWQEILSFQSDLSKGNFRKYFILCALRHSKLHLETPRVLTLSILQFPIQQTWMFPFRFLKKLKRNVIMLHCPVCALLLQWIFLL